MRVGINLFELIPGQGKGAGGEVYALNLIRNLFKIDADINYVLFCNNQNYETIQTYCLENEKVEIVVSNLNSSYKWTRPIFEQFMLPLYVKKFNIDILHSLFNTLPLISLRCKKVVTVCDLVAYFYKEKKLNNNFDFKQVYYRLFQRLMLPRADMIIAISEFTRNEIVKRLKIDENKIKVVHLASQFISDCSLNNMLTSIDNKNKYFLTVGSGALHKNIKHLIDALVLYNSQSTERVSLKIVGQIPKQRENCMLSETEIVDYIKSKKAESYIKILGYVTQQELDLLYKNAYAFIFSSLYEGFGLPVLEAMSKGLPVACSSASSLPEIAGEAAIFFDPSSIDDMTEKIKQIILNPKLRDELIQRGYEQVKKFSWALCAQETLSVYDDVIHNDNFIK